MASELVSLEATPDLTHQQKKFFQNPHFSYGLNDSKGCHMRGFPHGRTWFPSHMQLDRPRKTFFYPLSTVPSIPNETIPDAIVADIGLGQPRHSARGRADSGTPDCRSSRSSHFLRLQVWMLTVGECSKALDPYELMSGFMRWN